MIRLALYLGLVLVAGAAIVPRWIAPQQAGAMRRYFRAGLVAGFVLIYVGTAMTVAETLARTTGTFDPALVGPYVFETRQGRILTARLFIVALLAPAALVLDSRGWPNVAFVGLGVALLSTFSLTGHAGASGRLVTILADIAHLGAVTAWVGTLFYVAWLPMWSPRASRPGDARTMIRRVSTLGLTGASVSIATGVYASVVHLWGPQALSTTAYGQALSWKVIGVLGVLAVAAVNRWFVVPAVERQGASASLGRWMKIETLALLAVLAISGVLVTRAIPEPPATMAGTVRFRESAGAWTVHGTLAPGTAGLVLELTAVDAQGRPAPDSVDVQVALVAQDHPMDDVTVNPSRVAAGAYRADIALPMAGKWEMRVRVAGGEARVPVRATPGSATGRGWASLVPGAVLLGVGLALTMRLLAHATGPWRRR